mmetsp:Transcript_14983/g.42336  ORF Transcript_14983/g.42336 Transcript_14983/m.42336 type:complete len:246 (+) Transcript_14983:157-894(+)
MVSLYKEVGAGINPYALDYPICTNKPMSYQNDQANHDAVSSPSTSGKAVMAYSSQALWLLKHSIRSQMSRLAEETGTNPPWLPDGDVFRPCAEEHLETYLNRPDVTDAIHATLGDGQRWTACSSVVQYDYHDAMVPQMDLYAELIGMLHDHAIHIMVYSGDDDSVCSLAGTQSWIWDLDAKPKRSKMWQPWTVNNQTAGYATEFKTHGLGSFTFVTVHGAGHEVPLYRPMEALEMFRRYLHGSGW